MNFSAQLHQKAQLVNTVLQQLLASRPIDSDLKEVLHYTLEGPGKRIRSALVLWSCELVSPPKAGINRNSEIAAAAIEMVHTYSLVHDDLPAMDNDDLRRGRPTCHKAFDEASAILAGDALLTLAFEILAREIDKPAIAVKLIGELAEAAGPGGMIAGQLADMKFKIDDLQAAIGKQKSEIENQVRYIHINKTAKLFRCAAAMGAICGGANENQCNCLCEYGLKLGLGFQIADDILDVCASSEQLGKTAGKDAIAGKITYPAVAGVEKSEQLAKKLADESIAALESFGSKADTLRELAMAMLERTK
jgi:geranylgeranyl pyrophosphate synthase